METYYVREFIKETQGRFGRRQTVYCLLCVCLSVPNVLLSIYFKRDMVMAAFIIVYNVLIVSVLLTGAIFRRYDWLMLGHALMCTGTSASFAFMGFYVLDADEKLLLYYLIFYIPACALRIFCIRRAVRSGRYFAKGKTKSLPLILMGIPAVGMGQVLARGMADALSYETNMAILACIMFFLVMLFSLGGHLYLCFYYMRKYKVK